MIERGSDPPNPFAGFHPLSEYPLQPLTRAARQRASRGRETGMGNDPEQLLLG